MWYEFSKGSNSFYPWSLLTVTCPSSEAGAIRQESTTTIAPSVNTILLSKMTIPFYIRNLLIACS
jgi:hypothetical protein